MGDIRPKFYRFGPFEIDLDQRLLFRAGDSVPLTPKAFDTLAVLVERPGKVVDKTELLKLVWPDTFVEENNLTQNISALRKVFGDGDYIETIPRRGYRFLMDVQAGSSFETGTVASQPEPGATPRHRFHAQWIGAVVVVAAAAFILYAVTRNRNPVPTRMDSLVVLPFIHLTPDAEDEYFSDGLTEELTNSLARLEGLRVVARTTAFQFKGTARDIRSIAQQLQVNAVLEGSVRRQAQKLRVTVQLIDARTGYHVWSQTYDRALGDIFSIQEDISNQVARAIRPDHHSTPATLRGTDLETHNLYLLGRFHRSKPDQASVRKAIAFFKQAIDKDPRYAAAYAGLAECYIKMAQQNSMPPVEAWAAAQTAVDQALTLDENLAEAHTSQAIVKLLLDRNWEAAERHFRRAIALNGNDPAAHHWFSHYFAAMGRWAESLTESQLALGLDPLDVQIRAHLIFHYVAARDFPNAIKAGQQTLELDQHSRLAYLFLTWAYEDSAQWDKAIEASQRGAHAHPEASTLQAALRAEGPRGYWRVKRTFLAQQMEPDNYRLAISHARLGEADQAMVRLEQAFQKREPDLINLKSEPAFDWMQENVRFRALTKAMRLP